MKKAGIYVNDLYCGVLTEDEEGFHFVYDETYLAHPGAAPISHGGKSSKGFLHFFEFY